jgi:hypothetical protein
MTCWEFRDPGRTGKEKGAGVNTGVNKSRRAVGGVFSGSRAERASEAPKRDCARSYRRRIPRHRRVRSRGSTYGFPAFVLQTNGAACLMERRALPMMKHPSLFGAAIWNGAMTLLAAAAFFMFWGLIACGVYIVAKELGFHQRPRPPSLYWLVVVGLLLAGILYQLNKLANRP